jgi:SAM-dependent methyltransferase
VTTARYDGYADWYDERLAEFTLAASETLVRLLGEGRGRCLDLCCGTGLHLPGIMRLGWCVTGVDVSADQLRVARDRAGDDVELLLADAADLPFEDGTFDAVVSMFTHTDVDDFAALVREGARVLRPGGAFVYAGLHPCFVGHHARFIDDDTPPELHGGYADTARHFDAPGIAPDGLRAKVGAIHLPLDALLQAFLAQPLRLVGFEEDTARCYPRRLALRAIRDQS